MAVANAPPRAVFASDPDRGPGRLVPEPPSPTRSAFRRDCDRVIHATAFRRLKHKTQVFVFHEGDHFRTRLTHSLEVAQIGRAIARSLGADEDLTETLALAHDLGHPPFGHAGERALDAAMAPFGGFDHNAQTLRVVTRLERRYPEFDGLNLTWETLEGIVKHNGPALAPGADEALPWALAEYLARHDLEISTYAGVEAQAAAIADDIAYNAHDIDDGLRAGLFTLDDLLPLPLVGDILRAIRSLYPGLDGVRQGAQLVRMLITGLVEDVIAESKARLAALNPRDVAAVRAHFAPVVAQSAPFSAADREIKAFLFARMYRHPRVIGIMTSAESVVRDLFSVYMERPEELPAEWENEIDSDRTARARLVSDFIAGMTDRFALDTHRRFFDLTPELR